MITPCFAVIVETTDAKGSLHSSYLLVNSLDAHSIISNLVVAIQQSQQPQATDDTTSEYEDSSEEEETFKAQIYLDCHPVGSVNLAASFKQMMQLSTDNPASSSLRAVRNSSDLDVE